MLRCSKLLGYDGSMSEKPTLHVIQGSVEKDDPRVKAAKVRKRKPAAASLISCHRCGGNAVLEVKLGMVFKDGKASGGTKQLLCASCFMRGERVVIG